jgi:hypothetical protein
MQHPFKTAAVCMAGPHTEVHDYVLLPLQERRTAHSLISHGQQHVFKAWPKQGEQLHEVI